MQKGRACSEQPLGNPSEGLLAEMLAAHMPWPGHPVYGNHDRENQNHLSINALGAANDC